MKKVLSLTVFWGFVLTMIQAQATVVEVVVNSMDHDTLEAAVIAAGLDDDLSGEGPFTVFAPTDAAFAALPEGTLETLLADPTGDLANILLHHVLGAEVLSTDLTNGQIATTLFNQDIKVSITEEGVFINGAQVTTADIQADNGVVHVIDAVLLPPSGTVVDVIVNSEDHEILESAVIAAELVDDLSADGPFTVFAPTDDAFTALGQDAIDALLADPTGALSRTLLNHVVTGKSYANSLMDGQRIVSLFGNNLAVVVNNDGVFINGAQVTVTDIIATNGVVHVIDAVLSANNVLDIILNSDVHMTLGTTIIAAQLYDDLNNEGPFTVFAPTDDAFNALGQETIDALLADPTGDLANILLYHVLGADVRSTDLSNGQIATTLLGQDIKVTINEEGVFINDAQVTTADLVADNGVVHVLDAVLLPPSGTVVDVVVNSEDHTILETAVVAAGLTEALSAEGPFTVFAPTDDAFTALGQETIDALLADPTGELASILQYHVLGDQVYANELENGQIAMTLGGQDVKVTINEEGVFINDAQVTVTDILATNGVVHVLDAVLLPPAGTVVDVVVNSEVHNTLETAVVAAGLAEALGGEGPFTVFAPTDDAFAALGQETIDALLADPTGDLANILQYHVVNDKVYATDLMNGSFVTTLAGQDIEVTINDEGVLINNARVTVTDILATNGVVHVIDAVILPPTGTVVDVVVNSEVHNTLETAVIAAGLVDALNAEGPFTVFAPTDDAFAALGQETIDALLADPTGDLANILQYHVINGKAYSTGLTNGQIATTLLGQDLKVTISEEGVFINDAQVTVTDILASNGVVHVIDAVLLPPAGTVVDVVVNSDVHNTLETAVVAAGLADALGGEGPFTVFAPTDDAFAALGQETIDALLADPTGDLANILQYHVVEGKVYSSSLSNGQSATTLFGTDIFVTINDTAVFINQARVTVADILATNGVVHVIDAVLDQNFTSTNNTALNGLIRIFPNPVKGQFQIIGQDLPASNFDVTLFDFSGKLVKSWKSIQTNQPIGVAEIPNGTYHLQVRIGQKMGHQKVVVQN